jgi:alpha-tubulin suppressor-like RCC1 family protein
MVRLILLSNVNIYVYRGSNSNMVLTQSQATSEVPTPTLLNMGSLTGRTVVEIAGGSTMFLALTSTNEVHGWGNNLNGQLGINSTVSPAVPVQITFPDSSTIIFVTASYSADFSLAIDSYGEVYFAGQ